MTLKKEVYRFPHEPNVPQRTVLAMPVHKLPLGMDLEGMVLGHNDLRDHLCFLGIDPWLPRNKKQERKKIQKKKKWNKIGGSITK